MHCKFSIVTKMRRGRQKRRVRRPTRGRQRRRRRRQDGGILPLLALAVPALVAASKAAALGGVGAAAGYGVKKGLDQIK